MSNIFICNNKPAISAGGTLLIFDVDKCCILCPEGQYWNGIECVPYAPPGCPPGTHWDFRINRCVPDCVATECPPNTHWNQELCSCVNDCPTPTHPCEVDEKWSAEICDCILKCTDQTCVTGFAWDKTRCTCVPIAYRCDTETNICSEVTGTPEPGDYSSLTECAAACREEPCATSGCNFEIQYYYEAPGGHCCDRAEWDAYVGARKVGHINLDNLPDCGSRQSSWFPVLPSDFDSVNCVYSFKVICTKPDSNCHTGVPSLRIKRGGIVIMELPDGGGGNWSIDANRICNLAP